MPSQLQRLVRCVPFVFFLFLPDGLSLILLYAFGPLSCTVCIGLLLIQHYLLHFHTTIFVGWPSIFLLFHNLYIGTMCQCRILVQQIRARHSYCMVQDYLDCREPLRPCEHHPIVLFFCSCISTFCFLLCNRFFVY